MKFTNPYKPGAGHRPPYLAGRAEEIQEFERLLQQQDILENLILTGLRGVGKTVLMDEFKPVAINNGWIWIGSDLSETTSVSEHNLAIRILTDISVFTSSILLSEEFRQPFGFLGAEEKLEQHLNFNTLVSIYENIPGLTTDKLRGVLELVHHCLPEGKKKIIFAYDEAQNLSDNAAKDQYPLSVLLDVFQSIQRKGIQFMLALAGLPTLQPKLVEARTFAERMFRVIFLSQLSDDDSKAAILEPLDNADCPITPTEDSVDAICKLSGGYPYFIQFVCKEVYDIWVITPDVSIPIEDLNNKLDADFFAGRWARATDRQRDLLIIISGLSNSDTEFTVQEIATSSKSTVNPFSNSHINQMLSTLTERGLVYKNRHGKYSFAVPLLGRFIKRQVMF